MRRVVALALTRVRCSSPAMEQGGYRAFPASLDAASPDGGAAAVGASPLAPVEKFAASGQGGPPPSRAASLGEDFFGAWSETRALLSGVCERERGGGGGEGELFARIFCSEFCPLLAWRTPRDVAFMHSVGRRKVLLCGPRVASFVGKRCP